MEKSIFTAKYDLLRIMLREVRKRVGVTQIELAERLHETQSFVSKFERGERRLDIIQLRTVCQTLGLTLAEFVKQLEKELHSR